jgi:cell division septal protein FtsQ
MRLIVILVALVIGVTADNLRVAQNKHGRRHLKVQSVDGSIEVSDDKTHDKLEAKLDKDSYVLTFKVGKNNFQIRSSPKLQELEIRKIGSRRMS